MLAGKRSRSLFFLAFKIGLGCNREDVIHGDRLHADVITANALPVVVSVYTRAAGQLHIDWYGARSQRAKQERRLRPEQGDDGDRGHGSEVSRTAIVGNKQLGQRVE